MVDLLKFIKYSNSKIYRIKNNLLKKIVIAVTNDLTTDQRVHKVCTTLLENGCDILLIGRKRKSSIPIERSYKTTRMRLLFENGPLFYAEYNVRLFFKLLFTKFDICVANDLDTLLASYMVHKIRGKQIVYDSHELFTEVPELVHRPKIQKIWLTLEQYLLPKIHHKMTVCDSIAAYYKRKYQSSFEVIRNIPVKKALSQGSFPFDTGDKTIILYQGAVNVGRGLELMIETMSLLSNTIFVIIGAGDILKELQEKVAKQNKGHLVKFMGSLEPEKLRKLTPLADIGISLEEDLGLNYRYALPNKIFDYIQSGIPVICSDLPEMKKIICENNIGEVLIQRAPKNLAITIQEMVANRAAYSTQLVATAKKFTWEKESKKLLKIYKGIL